MTNSGWHLKRISAPEAEPITLEEAKSHLRVVISADDELIAGMISAAREAAESYTRRAFVWQVWEAGYDRFPSDAFQLAKPPLIGVDSISYTDDSDVVQTLPASSYVVDDYAEPARLLRPLTATWPSLTSVGTRVRVRFTAGYPAGAASPTDYAANVPAAIKQAIKVHLGDMYENRDVSTEMPFACEALLHPFRVYGWGDA